MDIRELSRVQLKAILSKAEIRGKGLFKPPSFDPAAIKDRADKLDPKSQIKADIYTLLCEVERLTK